MRIKTTLITLATAMTIACNAGGLYIVSGGDFRQSHIKYTLQTTEQNQTIEVSPNHVFPLSAYQNAYKFPWSVKADGIEHSYEEMDGINNTIDPTSTPGQRGLKNGEPWMHEFANPGNHLVKVYDTNANIYQISFTNNNALTALWIDFEHIKSSATFGKDMKIWISKCPYLKSIYYGLPATSTTLNNCFQNVLECENIEITHPESFTSIRYCFINCGMTNDMVFANLETTVQLGDGAFKVQKAYLPNIKRLDGARNFNLSLLFGSSKTNPLTGVEYAKEYPNWGLKELTISDKLTFIGQNSFYRQDKLNVINFICDDADWVATWNANRYFRIFFGKAAQVEGDATTTTLSYDSDVEVTTAEVSPIDARSSLAHPTTLNVIRRGE